jgi:hypothetical protein
MRTRIVTSAAGIILSVAIASCETYGAATGVAIPQPVRIWMVGAVIAAVIVIATQAALDQLIAAIRNEQVQQRARDDFERIQNRLRDNGDGVTYLYPEE